MYEFSVFFEWFTRIGLIGYAIFTCTASSRT